MAKCPNCDKEIPFFRFPSFKHSVGNFSRFTQNKIYVCPKCKHDYSVTDQSWNGTIFILALAVGVIYLAETFLWPHIPYNAKLIIFLVVVLNIPVGHYIWWRYFAKLRIPSNYSVNMDR
jgi:hypothetical protein